MKLTVKLRKQLDFHQSIRIGISLIGEITALYQSFLPLPKFSNKFITSLIIMFCCQQFGFPKIYCTETAPIYPICQLEQKYGTCVLMTLC